MAKLSSEERNKLPKKAFAGKGRSYPIEDKGHAKAAIARAKEFHPSDEKSIIAKAEKKLHGNHPKNNEKHHHKLAHEMHTQFVKGMKHD